MSLRTRAYTAVVVPTMILFGLVAGRWWRMALVLAAFVWPALILVGGAIDSTGEVLGASAIGVLNAGAGVLVHQAVLQAYRRWP